MYARSDGGSFGIHSGSIRDPFGVRLGSVRANFGTKVSEPKIQIFKNFRLVRPSPWRRRPHKSKFLRKFPTKIERVIHRKSLDVRLRSFWTMSCSHLLSPVRTYADAFGFFWMHRDALECAWSISKNPKISKIVAQF